MFGRIPIAGRDKASGMQCESWRAQQMGILCDIPGGMVGRVVCDFDVVQRCLVGLASEAGSGSCTSHGKWTNQTRDMSAGASLFARRLQGSSALASPCSRHQSSGRTKHLLVSSSSGNGTISRHSVWPRNKSAFARLQFHHRTHQLTLASSRSLHLGVFRRAVVDRPILTKSHLQSAVLWTMRRG
jgi:hypothetical protein